jgi:hypothetical protein
VILLSRVFALRRQNNSICPMPMTLEEHKAEIDQLVDRIVGQFGQIRELQMEVGEKIAAAIAVHGNAAVPFLDDAIRKMKVGTLYALPTESNRQM